MTQLPAASAPRTLAVCLVCSGNICRSPMAERVLRERLGEAGLAGRVRVESAGFESYHAGDPADPRTEAVLAEHGYPPAEHEARVFEPARFDRLDLVIGLDGGHLRRLRRAARGPADLEKLSLLRSWDPAAPPGADVPDPYYGGVDGFEECLRLIEPACAGLLAHLAGRLADGPVPAAGEAAP